MRLQVCEDVKIATSLLLHIIALVLVAFGYERAKGNKVLRLSFERFCAYTTRALEKRQAPTQLDLRAANNLMDKLIPNLSESPRAWLG